MALTEKEIFEGSAKVGFGMFHPATQIRFEDEEGKNWFQVKVTCGCRGTKGGHDPRSGAWRFYQGKLPECKNSKKTK
jgi:hypothetical protein